MSPESRTAATAEPGSSRSSSEASPGPLRELEALAAAGADAPDGAESQPAAPAMRSKSPPGARLPENDTGSGRTASPAAGDSLFSGASSSSRTVVKARSRNPAMNWDARVAAAPPIGTGGDGGALRMSSMLWIGVMPQIGSRENGQPYARAPTSFSST